MYGNLKVIARNCLFLPKTDVMIEFRTPVTVPSGFKIGYSDKIMMFGSCFAENIGEKLVGAKLNAVVNPFGILFNPESVAAAIEQSVDGTSIDESSVFEHNGLWSNYAFHGSFSSADKCEALQKMNRGLQLAHERISITTLLIVTFGTAFVYRNVADGKVVANCHKMPATSFVREMLTVQDIISRYSGIIEMLKKRNGNIQIVFTVSPVRHLRDGAHENQLSKSTLLLAVDWLAHNFSNVYYFPSYEIMMDDLRDYRFYDSDMVHPSDLAIEYIWQGLRTNCFSQADLATMDEIQKIAAASQHRPINPDTEEFKSFVSKQLAIVEQFARTHTDIDMSQEIAHWNNCKCS